MRPDIKWRISSQGSKKLKSKSFLSFVMVFAALIFLGFVYLFSLYDQRITLKKFKETNPISIALNDFHAPESLAKISDQPLLQIKISSKDRESIKTILQNFNLETPTFVLAQIAYHAQNHQQNDIFYISSEKFHAFLSQTFANDVSKEISPSDSLPSNALFNLNAKPFDNPEKLSLITLVILKLGEDAALTEKAIKSLPKEITFGYLPYGDQIATSIQSAVNANHEVLMMIPMEPLDYPDSDPGAGTLLTGLDASQLQQRLQVHLQKSKQIIGITNFLGSRFAFSSSDVKILIDELES
ncbi:MAG: divergent polysaccharide deacetylase family protein [Janthinobacterium lividum]